MPNKPSSESHDELSSKTPTGSHFGNASDDFKDRTLGEFRILRRLGKGGMAEVFLAEQTSLKRKVALKILRPDLVSDEVYLKRFELEAKAAAGLNHPNIVQVYLIGEDQGEWYIAQEYVQGQNLKEFIQRKGPPELNVALHIMKQAVSALKSAGDAGIVHRDLKPENILVTRKGHLKIADFGLAQLSIPGENTNLTQEGVTMGTPLYMSPEQVNGKKLDQRSDIYSLGVTFYHLLSGRAPFQGKTALAVAVKHLNETPFSLQKWRSDLPPELCNLVHQMMAKTPADRYANSQDILTDLQQVSRIASREVGSVDISASNFSVTEESITPTVWTRLTNTPHKRQMFTLIASCLGVAILSAIVGFTLRPDNPLDNPALAQETQVPQLETAQRQENLALILNTEEAWKAVINHPEDNELSKRRSEEHLALLYLTKDRYDEAQSIFRNMVSTGDQFPETKAKGLAGQAIIASISEEYQRSQEIINLELFPMKVQLRGNLAQLLQRAIAENRIHTGKQLEQDYDSLFDTESRESIPEFQ